MSAEALNQLADPNVPTVLRPENLSAVPTDELYLLIDQVFGELDSPNPSPSAVLQYDDLIGELELRKTLNLPELQIGGEGK